MIINNIQYFDNCEFLNVISQYFEKNTRSIKDGIGSSPLLCEAVKKGRDLEWFNIIFELSNKVNALLTKDDFNNALNEKNFNQLSKECQTLIKENFKKFYAK